MLARTRFVVILAMVGAAACGARIQLHGDAATLHPLSGQARHPEVVIRNEEGCAPWQIDMRACTLVGRLVRADASEVCVELVVGEYTQSPFVDQSRIEVVSSTGSSDAGRAVRSTDQAASFRGVALDEVESGRSMVCVETASSGCVRYEEQTSTRSVARATVYPWRFATRQVCFANDGALLSPETEWLEARMIVPRDERHLKSMGFRWQFQAAPPAR